MCLSSLISLKSLEASVSVYTNLIDPSRFYSAPKLGWEAMLISTNVKLGLLEDIDMLLFFRAGYTWRYQWSWRIEALQSKQSLFGKF